MTIDYRALIRDRKAKQTRPIVRHPLCLDPERYSALEEAQDTLRQLLTQSAMDGERDPDEDRRAGGLTPLQGAIERARAAVTQAEQDVAEVTVMGVFKAPTADRQAEQHQALNAAREADPDRANSIVITQARANILEAFDHCEGPGRQRLDLEREDIAMVIEEWSQGELMVISNKLTQASTGAPDLPFSVRSLLANQPSAGT